MLQDEGLQDDQEEGSYINSNVGDDDGKKEYPFITSFAVLSVMRKLYDFHKKQLVHDFINSASDYECCPKGSYLSKEAASIPGPYYSCPILHESGDDLFALPIPRRLGRLKATQPFMRKSKKRTSCRKCALVTFNHYDSSIYHENYLKECTYAKLRASTTTLPSFNTFYNRNLTELTTTCSEQKFFDKDDDIDTTCASPTDPCYPQWTKLTDFIEPWKPVPAATENTNMTLTLSKCTKRVKSATKPVVASRYRDISRTRPNVNTLHVNNRLTDCKGSKNNRQEGDSDEPSKNPFPMPDVFEGIYFGQMPESINSLPVPLQNFKKIQMKMAGENCTPRSLESHKNCPAVSPPELLKVTTTPNICCGSTFQDRRNHLPPIMKSTPLSSPTVKGGIRYRDSVSRIINKTSEAAMNNSTTTQKLVSRKTMSYTNRNIRTVSAPLGKKKVLVLPAIRTSSRKISTPIGSSSQKTGSDPMTRKNKSLGEFKQSREMLGAKNKNKRKKKILSKLIAVKPNAIADLAEPFNEQVDHDKMFDSNKHRESFIAGNNKKIICSGDHENGQGSLTKSYQQHSSNSPITITIHKKCDSTNRSNSTINLVPQQIVGKKVTATTGVSRNKKLEKRPVVPIRI